MNRAGLYLFACFFTFNYCCHFFLSLIPIMIRISTYRKIYITISHRLAASWLPANEKAMIVGNFPMKVADENAINETPDTPAIKLTPAEGSMGTTRPMSTAKNPFVSISDR